MSDIKVGISDLAVAKNGEGIITYALGSCIGICLFDSVRKVAGLSHIMLPTSEAFKPTGTQIYKFADLAIPELVRQMELQGAKRICMKAKIAGGAQMFPGVSNSNLANIGQRNIIAVKQSLAQLKIPIIAEDTGKNYGRTQLLNSKDGVMTIKSVNRGQTSY